MQLVRPDNKSIDLARPAAAYNRRLHRSLTAKGRKRAGLTADQVQWLEEGRVFASPRPTTRWKRR